MIANYSEVYSIEKNQAQWFRRTLSVLIRSLSCLSCIYQAALVTRIIINSCLLRTNLVLNMIYAFMVLCTDDEILSGLSTSPMSALSAATPSPSKTTYCVNCLCAVLGVRPFN